MFTLLRFIFLLPICKSTEVIYYGNYLVIDLLKDAISKSSIWDQRRSSEPRNTLNKLVIWTKYGFLLTKYDSYYTYFIPECYLNEKFKNWTMLKERCNWSLNDYNNNCNYIRNAVFVLNFRLGMFWRIVTNFTGHHIQSFVHLRYKYLSYFLWIFSNDSLCDDSTLIFNERI